MSSASFPTQDLLPKTETNALEFLEKYPQYNGKDITIGILDTGVDPGAIGLSTLPDGGQKLVHVADCTGSGDVKMDTEVLAKKDNKGWIIEKDLFGNELVLSGDLNLQPFPKKDTEETKGETEGMPVRLALKRAYDLFPKKLINRVKKHYAEQFEKENHRLIVPLQNKLSEWKAKFGDGKPTKQQILEKEDIEAQLDALNGKFSSTDPLKEDIGPVYQIILFYDGKDFRVIIVDADQCHETSGDFTKLPMDRVMTDFHKEFQYSTFSSVDMMNYAVNIYKNGEVVSVVVDAGAHGSHVAGITARYHPSSADNEEANGVAPGAKIVALKIGDSRLGSMETGTAMTRAMIEAVKHKCDVINLSYGEGCVLPNTGRFVELAEQLVYKHGIVFVSSAGNNGPALSTVGAPGGTTDAILGVAAYVSPNMMKAEYSMEPDLKDESNPGTTYTWSSVGPTADGAQGVDITAPGAAIACVPNWCLQRNQLMNGTSMSSPNATGCIALLLSAAKAEGIKMTPVRLKRALQNTATKMPGLSPLQQGHGMVNVDAAWEYIKSNKDDIYEDVCFKTEILNRSGGPRGVYLRHQKEMEAIQNYSVFIDPIFGTSDDVNKDTQMKRVEFEMKFSLKCTADFVHVPDYFLLMHNGRSFKFDVDPTKLPAGVHTASIYGYDTTKPELGPRFHIPITIAKTLEVDDTSVDFGELEFSPNEVKRYFIDVPKNATWMDITIKDLRNIDVDQETSSRLFVLHTLQLLPHNAYRDAEEQKYYQLMPNQEQVASIPVHAGVVIEMDFARYWNAQGTTKVSAQVRFRGVTPNPNNLTIVPGRKGGKVRVESSLADEYISPKAILKKYWHPICPKKSGLIKPCCDERDVLTSNGKQIHQLVLEYEYDNKEAGNFVPRAPALQGVLYESAFESQLMLIFDEEKRYIGVADSWPSDVKAPKGKITIRLQVRHDDISKLEALKNLPIMIEKSLKKEITLLAYSNHASMITSGPKMRRRLLRQGTNTCIIFAEPDDTSECEVGDVIFGSMTFADGASSLPGEGKKPDGFEVKYVVGTKAKEDASEKASPPEAEDKRSDEEKLEEAIRSTKLDHLKKLAEKKEDADKFIVFYEKLTSEYSNHLPLLMEGLKFHDNKETRKENLDKVIAAADNVIEAVDKVKLAVHFGMKHDDEDADSCKEHKEQEEIKTHLIDALARKARAIADSESSSDEDFEKALKELEKWTDTSANKFAVLTLEHHRRTQRYGLMLKLLSGLLEKIDEMKSSFSPLTKAQVLEQRQEVLEKLSFTHLKKRDEIFKATTPKDFAPF